MILRTLAGILDLEVVWGEELMDAVEVDTCYAADLMSDVLAFSQAGALLVTGLTSVQSAHTADLADLAAVLYVAGKRPVEAVYDMARSKGIPLLSTTCSMFEACGILHRAGLRPAHRRPSPAEGKSDG